MPEKGDRVLHGNVSFTAQYFDRVSKLALEKQSGICFMHSHLTNGWQSMSDDDIVAEESLAPRVKALTGLPLVGLTLSRDHFWSGRWWPKVAPKVYHKKDCPSIRVVGKVLNLSINDNLFPDLKFDESISRTISAWGIGKQAIISRLKVGIVGLGSVGSIVAEALIKTGVRHLVLIDFDIVKRKNLDRLNGIGTRQIGQLKVEAIKNYLLSVAATPNELKIDVIPYSIAEQEGLLAALDSDVLFSCVDRPWPRFILNAIAYGNYIPVIDGGIDCSPNKKGDNLGQARWKAHTAAPGRQCLCCLGQYAPEDVALEKSGMLEDQHYISNLPKDHFVHRGENVYAFSLNLASMEIQQLLSLLLQPNGQYIGPKEYNFNSGNIDSDFNFHCKPNCSFSGSMLGQGDGLNKYLSSPHAIAEATRNTAFQPQQAAKTAWYNRLFKKLTSLFKHERN
ncbi:ThiF family adenylyltransferase [Mucilaginibacter sp. CAU 1740]|uniref:HesA/MoeB/ThiF family protein n=1 Tax=Mucilaginibacter sp. CAU 1740 TaxID=3140365 RepID=UPI00325A90BD